MFRILLCLLFIFSNLMCEEFYLNPDFEKKIQKNSRAYYTLKDYVRFLNEISALNQTQKILKVNSYINQIVPMYDADNYNHEEHWASTYEFLSKGGGDCEDYVIAKRYTLELLEIPSKDMFFTVVKEKFFGGDHMVLSLHVNKTKQPIVLDNLSTNVMEIKKRVDLEPIFFFNEFGFYKLSKYTQFKKIEKINIHAYENLKIKEKNSLILKK